MKTLSLRLSPVGFSRVFACLSLLLLLSACAPSAPTVPPPAPTAASTVAPTAKPAAQVEKVTVSEGAHVIGYAPVYIAQKLGYFKDEGLEVEIVASNSSAQAVAAVVGGSADIALSAASDVVQVVGKGQELRMIAAITNQAGMQLTLSKKLTDEMKLTPQSNLADRIKALKGTKLAVTAAGSLTDQTLRALLKQYGGFDPDRDVQIVAMGGGGSEMLAGLKQGTIDGFFISPPVGAQAASQGFGVVSVDLVKGEVPEFDGFTFQVASSSLNNITKRQSALVKFLRGLARAEKLLATDSETAKAAALSAFPNIDPKVFDLSFASTLPSYAKSPLILAPGMSKVIGFSEFRDKLTFNQVVDTSLASQAQNNLP